MSRLSSAKPIVAWIVCLSISASSVFAGGPRLVPIQLSQPAPYVPPATETAGPGAEPIAVDACTVPLYGRVRYRDERKVHPCAVPMVVMIQDPCWRDDPCDPCDVAPCVAVEVCVPPCNVCPPRITCRRHGAFVRYDFGKYAVEIRSHRNGLITVDYDRCLL